MNALNTPEIILLCAGVASVGLIAVAPLFISKCDRDEANSKPICAWCHPGVNHAAGHGICKKCFDKEMEKISHE